MPHQIFFVEELVMLITKEVIEYSYEDAICLALTCRALESPALSVLWATQTTLSTLIRVLPQDTLAYTSLGECPQETRHSLEELNIVKDPSKEDWNRLRRYGSWMRALRLNQYHADLIFVRSDTKRFTLGKTVFTRLSLAFPTGLVCSGLRKLKWLSSHHWSPYLRLFLSPTLAKIKIFTTPPDGPIQTPPPAILTIPGSYLRSLQLTFHPADDEAFGNSVSATILQCGASLERLETSVRLSQTAVSHLVGLRYLRTLRIGSDPPSDPAVSSSGIFPSLESLVLDNGVGHKWLSFLRTALEGSSVDEDLETPDVGMRATLTKLHCLGGMTIDSAFVSLLCIFRKLTHVFADESCSKEDGCTFLLTDSDITKLADALPDIKSLRLGSPCSANSCHTTAFSLLTLSTHCLKLKNLEIHFNTTKIGRYLARLFKEPQHETMRSLPRCPLNYLAVADAPISSRDIERTAIYVSGIFHGLQGFRGRHRKWAEASRQVKSLYAFRLQVAPDTCIGPHPDDEDDWYDEEDDYEYDSGGSVNYHPGPWEVPRVLGSVWDGDGWQW